MLLSFSRGAVLAAVLGAAFWFADRAAAPARRGGAHRGHRAAAAIIALWAFSQNALTDDRVPIDLRNQAGLQLGLLLVVTLVVLAAIGLAVGFARASHTPTLHQRDRAGVALLVGLALIPIGAIVALSRRRARAVGLDLRALGAAHRPVGGAAAQRQQPPDRRRQRARALLGRGAADLRGQRRGRRRRGRLRDRPQALPHGRRGGAPRARLRRADRGRPRPRRARRQPRAARRLAGERGARDRACAGAIAAARSRRSGSGC